jgi:hypothetical protein
MYLLVQLDPFLCSVGITSVLLPVHDFVFSKFCKAQSTRRKTRLRSVASDIPSLLPTHIHTMNLNSFSTYFNMILFCPQFILRVLLPMLISLQHLHTYEAESDSFNGL